MNQLVKRLLGLFALMLVIAQLSASPALAQATGADLSIAKTVDNPAPLDGATVVYTLTATNNGPDPATAVSVSDALPAGVTYVADDGAGAYSGGVWTIGALPVAGSATLHITAAVDANTDGDIVINGAAIAGAETDPNPGNDSAAAALVVRVNDLCAIAGSISPPGATAPIAIWGYTPGDCTRGLPAGLPGPVIAADAGDALSITLHNSLPVTTTLLFQGQAMIPDTTGVAPGGAGTYNFTAASPGTFLYEAGLLPHAEYQTAMGLAGVLIVRPATAGQAYDDAATAFDDEAVVLLGELDPALNNSANPAAFDMRDYAPKFYLINGQVYPDTDPIPTMAGHRVLLRYVNAGLGAYSMALLGLRQSAIAMDGSPFDHERSVVAETIAPGQTADMIAAIPAAAADGTLYPLYDGNLLLHNNKANNMAGGFGGMLTFLEVGAPPPPGADTTGPATSGMALTPNPTNGSVDVTVSASISDAASGGSVIQAAEFRIDTTAGAPTAMTATDAAFDAPIEAVEGTISAATLAGLSSGSHAIYVRGQDAAGNWGPFNHITLNLDRTGPTTLALTLSPNPSNGLTGVALNGTADDSASGGSAIAAAEYTIDGGAAQPMVISPAGSPVAGLSATIPAPTVLGLSQGPHTVAVRSQDALGNWGNPATITLIADRTGPTTGGLSAAPNPNNGTLGFNGNTPAVRVSATFADALATISAGEGFIDTIGANGTGFIFLPTDGLFNSATETAYSDIPLTTISGLSDGSHTLYIHGKDSAGNWGSPTGVVLVIDKTRPIISGVTATPNPTNAGSSNNTSFTLTANASDVNAGGSNITRAEWYEGPDPGAGNGVAMAAADGAFNSPAEALTASIDFVARGWTPGPHTVYVRAREAAGNWSLPAPLVVNVVLPNNIFADSFGSGNTSAWSAVTGGTAVAVTQAASLNGAPAFGLQTTLAGTAPRYLTDLTPLQETSYHARFYFHPNGALTGNNLANGYTIFAGLDAANAAVVQVQYRRQNQAGGTYQLRLVVQRAGGTTTTAWTNISNASHRIEIAWQSATSASVSLTIDGAAPQTLTGLNTSAYRIESALLGPSAGLTGAASGTMYFDAFVSTRNTVIGP